MKTRTLLGVVVLFICTNALAGNRHHVVIDGGMVHIRGIITAPACSVSAASSAQIVDMGQFRSNQFNGLGSYAAPVPFDISLTECTTAVSKQVSVNFLGVSDGKDPLVLKAGEGTNAATGVGLAIFDSSGEIIAPNALPQPVAYLHDGDMSLRFIARYRATSREVTGGNADAWTWFTLSYQ